MYAKPGIRILGATIVISLALIGSFVTSTVVASRAYLQKGEEAHRQERDLKVVGSARKRIESDWGTWRIRVAGEGKTLEEAYNHLEGAVGHVQKFLGEHQFEADAVTLGPIDTITHYKRDGKGNRTREVASYELRRTFEIATTEVKKIDEAAGKVTELVRSGIHVESLAPEYIFTKLNDLKIEMMGLATANARERGEEIARNSGCNIGVVKEARAGVFQITAPWSTAVASYGIYDTSSIEKDIRAVVHLLLTIESE